MQERTGEISREQREQSSSRRAPWSHWWSVWLCAIACTGLAAAPASRPARKAPPRTRPAAKRVLPKVRVRPTPKPANKALKLPPGIGPIDFPPLPKSKRRKPRKRRKRRKRYQPPPLVIPTISPAVAKDAKLLAAVIAQLKRRNWRLQYGIINQLVRTGSQTTAALHKALQHKHLRVRLLVAQTLAKRGDTAALPMLVKESRKLYDQPGSLLMGAWMAYGKRAIPTLRNAIAKGGHTHQLIRALGVLRAKKGLPLVVKAAMHPKESMRRVAREALLRYPTGQMVKAIASAIVNAKPIPKPPKRGASSSQTRARASLFRMLAYQPSAEGMALLIQGLRDPSSSIRFLTRISLEDQAKQVLKANPRKITRPPSSKLYRPWQAWWKKSKATIHQWYQRKRASEALRTMPTTQTNRIVLLYRTIHPIFAYGRMPLVVHDAAWKKPTPPQPGKLWYLPLPTKEFTALLQRIQRAGFFQWNPKMGRMRDLTVYHGKRKHRVSIGMLRHIDFEQLERTFLKYAKRKKLGLKFADFYQRRDEADLSREGQIGQWAFRSMDVLPKRKWNPRKHWKPGAEIEGSWGALRDVVRNLPSQTRLIAIDVRPRGLRLSTLLYGSRSQSRMTRSGILRSRRLHRFKLIGLGPHYLSGNKIEQMIFEVTRRPFPWASRSSPKKGPDISLLALFKKMWPHRDNRVIKLTLERGTPHRITARWKTRHSHTMLTSLAQLAAHSRGDRLRALRINASGQADRGTFRLIVQMQWEMQQPIQANTLPSFLKVDPFKGHEPFQPVYR